MRTNKRRITKRILFPLSTVLLVVMLVSVFSIYRLQQRNVNNFITALRQDVLELFPELVGTEERLLNAQASFLTSNQALQEAYLAGDREALLALTEPIYDTLRADFGVTHFYFINPDQTVFLRVHNPPRFGDVVNRDTLLEAVHTREETAGLELGTFGTFTLRLVQPWVVDGELIGYIELGEEVDTFLPKLQEFLNLDLVFMIDKDYLEQEAWEEGNVMLGKRGQWNQFSGYVVLDSTLEWVPHSLETYLYTPQYRKALFDINIQANTYRGGLLPLRDFSGKDIGYIVVLVNVDNQITALQNLLLLLVVISLFVGAILFGFFYLYISRMDDRLVNIHDELIAEIEERDRVEQQLRKLSRAVEQSSASVVITNLQGLIEYVNPAFTRVTGYTREEAVGSNPRILKSGVHAEEFYEELWDTISSGAEWQGELCNRKKDGELYWEFGSLSPVRDRDGNVTHYLAVKEDITERKRVRQELEKYRNQLEELVDERTAELTRTNEKLHQEITERKRVEAELRKHRNHLEELVKERTQRLELIASLSEQLSTFLDVDDLLDELVIQIREHLGYYQAHVYLMDPDEEKLVIATGTGPTAAEMLDHNYSLWIETSDSVVAQAARTKEVVSLNNVQALPGRAPNPEMANRFVKVAVPIIAENKVAGVLVVHQSKEIGLNEADVDLLRSFASHVAIDIVNARLFKQTQTALMETERLYIISRQMMSTTNLSELVAAVVKSFDIPVINRAILLVAERDEDEAITSMVLKASWYSGRGTPPRPVDTRYDWTMSTVVKVSLTTEPLFFQDVQMDEGVGEAAYSGARERNIRAMVVLPLLNQGKQSAVLMLLGDEPYRFSEQEVRPYLSLLGQLAVTVENHYLLEETQQRAQELAQAKEELTRLNADKDKFFSIVAHDLKGPFQPLLGNAELLAEMADMFDMTQIKSISKDIHRSGKQLLSLLENLLQWSRLQMGRMEYQPEYIDLHRVAEQSVNLLLGNAEAKQISLENCVPESTLVYADDYMMDTVIRNLTNNALKFTPKNGRVCIAARVLTGPDAAEPSEVEVSVADTGVGISAEDKDKLFQIEVHHSTTGTAKESGTGLGLIMCREMVELNGGRIWVETELGEGTTVKFTVPCQAQQVEEDDDEQK